MSRYRLLLGRDWSVQRAVTWLALLAAALGLVNVELVASLPSRFKMHGTKTKVLLRKAMASRLPTQTTRGAKRGFNVPIPSWLVGPLRDMVHDTFSTRRIRETGWFRPDVVTELVRAHEARERDHSRDIWTLLMFQTWYDHVASAASEAVQRRRVS